MAKLGNILFNRTLNQFLECKNLETEKGQVLIKQIRNAVNDNPDKILKTITQAGEPHKKVLKNICRELVEEFTDEHFLDLLSHDKTVFRVEAGDILSHATTIDTAKLFRQLHKPGGSPAEIIDVLDSHKHLLQPEDIINHALRLDSADAIHLLKLVEGTEKPIDLSNLSVQLDKIDSVEFKIPLLRYLGTVNDDKIPLLVARFLRDSSKLILLEALKTLDQLPFHFNASILLPYIKSMSGSELELALKIIATQADASLVPHLSAFLASKSTELNDFFACIVVEHADRDNFEKFLQRLEIEDDWTQQQSIGRIQEFSNEKFLEVARELNNHEQEFIRNIAQHLMVNLLDDRDLEKIEEFALSDNWQLRERAIQSLAKSSDRGAIAILKNLVDKWPEDYVHVLRAVRQLGFVKGLEIAFIALKHSQANVQHAALETIEELTTKKHASIVRDHILRNIPGLSNELKELAKMLVSQITRDFGLPDVQIDENTDTIPGAVGSPASRSQEIESQSKSSPLDKLKPGTVWMSRYHIKKEIGRGAMGRVMLVEDDMVDESLILKFMLPEFTVDQQSIERFKREVKYARMIGHRNVIRIHDMLLKDGICAISMEYFESRGLETILGGTSLDTRDGLGMLYQITSGMAAAHEQKVFHRDLKPSNILIDDKGHLKIVDFGIASAGSASEATLTQTGAIIGSPAYLSPERILGKGSDERSDIYSLGIIAYYMFSGKLPYSGEPMEVLGQHRHGNAPPITEVNKLALPEISDLVVKMMAVDPAARPQSMGAISEEVKKLLDAR